MAHKLFPLALGILLLGGACLSRPSPAARDQMAVAGNRADRPESTEAPMAMSRSFVGGRPAFAPGAPGQRAAGPAGSPAAPAEQIAVPRDRKVIRNGRATVEVASVERGLAALRDLAVGSGGYTGDESRSRDEHGIARATMTCRIPAGRLDSVVEKLKSLGTLEQLHVSASDITEEYFNIEIRLRNQRQLESRLLELLNRPTNKLPDLLEVEREIARVRGDIDQMEGRQRFWDNRVAISELAVEIHEPQPAVAAAEGGALAALRHSFSEAADNFVLALAGIISITGGLLPVVAALLILAWVLRRAWRWRRQRKAKG